MIAHLDLSSGASGDKLLGALLHAGERAAVTRGLGADVPVFSADDLRVVIAAIAPEARLVTERVVRSGIRAMALHVEAASQPPSRHWKDIRALIEAAPITSGARARALRAFELVAQAEALVHGTDLDHVHFHEVGAIDSIVDIVGVSVALDALGIEELVCTPLALGSGTVETSHGTLPVPAPATAEILAPGGVPTTPGTAPGELTTPTGAALVAANATGYGPLPPMRPRMIGYGAGSRTLPGIANVARLIIGEPLEEALVRTIAEAPAGELETVVLLESNLDHLSPEAVAFAAEELLAGGALDVWQTSAAMKKDRAGVVLSLLAQPADAERLAARMHALTGTLGVRRELVRSVVEREVCEVATAWGPARVKVGAGRFRPEHDDVARIAREHALPYDEVAREIERLARI